MDKYRSQLEKLVIERTHEIIELNKRIEFILGATKTGLDIIDKNYNIVYIDPEWQKVYGDPKGKKCYQYFMGRKKKCRVCGVTKAFATKRPVVTEEVLIKEGARPIQVTTIPYQDDKGNWLVAEVNVDMTEWKKKEIALRDSENKIREITDTLPVVVYQYQLGPGDKQKFIFLNKAAKAIFGVKPDEILKDFYSAWGMVLPEDVKPLFDSIKEKVPKFKPWTHDFRIKTPTGRIKWVHGISVPARHQTNGSIIYYGTLSDITKEKTTEEKLRRYEESLESMVRDRTEKLKLSEGHYRALFKFAKDSEEKFKTIFDNTRDGMLLVDPETRAFYMGNKSVCKMLGYTDDELKRLRIDDIHPKDDLPAIIKLFEGLKWTGKRLIPSIPVKKRDGKIIYADINASSIVHNGKKYLLGSFRDITERREIEAALQMSEDNYRSIFELANDAIMIRDINTFKTVDANRAACEMFGYSKNDIAGLYIKDFMTKEPHYTWKEANHFYKLAADGQPQVFEWMAKDRAGRTFWVEAKVKRAVVGGKFRLISMLRDISDRKRLETMKDNFMNTVSHELRTPLAAIKEGISIVLDGLEGEAGAENDNILRIVKKNVDRLTRLIDDVLDFQKLEADKMPFRMKVYNINEIIKECRDIMSPLANEKKLEFYCNPDADIPKTRFDKDKILQVMLNLVNNAIKFTKSGHVKLSSKLDKDSIIVSVEDTGIGIKPEDIPRMFKKFERVDSAAGSDVGGTGLGLPISKEIIEKHCGKIWVESGFGKGSIFSFALPIK